jgi:phosphate uptake regulator
VVGYDRIDLFDAEGFDPDRRRELERTAHALVGLQVVFLDTHRARLQSFLDARRHPVPKVLARAGLVVEEMAERLTEAVRGSSPVPIAELGAMEVESDRLYALTLRQLMLAQGDPALARRLEVREPRDLLGGRVVGKVYEEIADLLCRAASELEAGLRGPAWPGRLREDLERHAEALRTTLHDAALALQQSDRTVAHRVLRDREEGLRALLRTEQALARARLPHRQTASLAVFAWGVGTSRRLCGTIAEVALNQSIQSTATGSAPPAAASASAPQRA